MNNRMTIKIDGISTSIKNFCSCERVDSMQEELEHCVKDKDIRELRDMVVPTIKLFKTTMNEFTKEHVIMKDCVKEFDRSLCTKANK